MIARTAILPDRGPQVFVANLTNSNITILEGLPLGKWKQENPEKGQPPTSVIATLSQAQQDDKSPEVKLPEYLANVLDTTANLTSQEKRKLDQVLLTYEDCFIGGQYGLGVTDVEVHEIPVSNVRPIQISAGSQHSERESSRKTWFMVHFTLLISHSISS